MNIIEKYFYLLLGPLDENDPKKWYLHLEVLMAYFKSMC